MNEKNKLICKTMARLMELSVTEKEKDGTDIFVHWSPHCDDISVEVYLNGWENTKNSKNFTTYIRDDLDESLQGIRCLFAKINEYLGKDDEVRTEYRRLKHKADDLREKALAATRNCRQFKHQFLKGGDDNAKT